jgi:hypothetical protein
VSTGSNRRLNNLSTTKMDALQHNNRGFTTLQEDASSDSDLNPSPIFNLSSTKQNLQSPNYDAMQLSEEPI